MAKKKRAGKTKKTGSRLEKIQSKFNLVLRNLLLFIALSLVSLVLYVYFPSLNVLSMLFQIMAIVFGFVAIALLITFLVLWILRIVRK